MNCPYCGTKIEKDSIFCEKCGNKITRKIKKTTSEKFTPKHKWKVLVCIVCLFLIISVANVVYTYVQRENTFSYQYNLIEDRICSILGAVTGNKNNIKVSDREKYMKIYAENIVENLEKQMKKAHKLGLPTDICNIAEKYDSIDSRKITRIYSYEYFTDDVLSEIEKYGEFAQSDLLNKCIPAIIGKISDANAVAFSGAFHIEMKVKNKSSVSNAIWILSYQDDFSIAVVFSKNESETVVDAYPINVTDQNAFLEKLEMLFESCKVYI